MRTQKLTDLYFIVAKLATNRPAAAYSEFASVRANAYVYRKPCDVNQIKDGACAISSGGTLHFECATRGNGSRPSLDLIHRGMCILFAKSATDRPAAAYSEFASHIFPKARTPPLQQHEWFAKLATNRPPAYSEFGSKLCNS